MKAFRVKQKVSWKWAGGLIQGEVAEVFFDRIERVIKGKKIVRNGSKENPAYVVQSQSGNFALKLHSELSETSASISKSSLIKSLTK